MGGRPEKEMDEAWDGGRHDVWFVQGKPASMMKADCWH